MFSTSEKLAVFFFMIPITLVALLGYAFFYDIVVQPHILSHILYVTPKAPSGNIILSKFFFAGIEEYFFRVMPITLLLALRKGISLKGFWIGVAAVSALFGWMHGGILKIPLQGVLGMILAVEYIIVYAVWRESGASFWASTSSHALYNLVLYVLSIP